MMLLALVLVLEQSSVVIQLVLRRMMKVHWMLSVERSLELGRRTSAAMVRLLLVEHWPVSGHEPLVVLAQFRFALTGSRLMMDHEPLVVVVQFRFAHDVHHFLRRLPGLHLLDLLVHLECHRYCPRLVAVQIVTCLVQDFEFFERLLFLPRPQHWSEYSQPCWLRLEEE